MITSNRQEECEKPLTDQRRQQGVLQGHDGRRGVIIGAAKVTERKRRVKPSPTIPIGNVDNGSPVGIVPGMFNLSPIRLGLVFAVATFAATAGCGESKSESASSQPPSEVRIGYFANATHAQAVLAVDSGEFAKAIQPAKLTTRVFNAGPALIESLFAGEVDIGYVGPGPAISAYAKSHGEGIRVISGAAANGVLIVAAKDSGINSIADLKGKRIATPQHGNTQDIAARYYLINTLKQADTTNVIPVANAEQAAMMDRKQIDAAWAPEPWGSRLIIESGAKLVAQEKDLWPEKKFALTVVVTTPEFLKKHPEVVKKVLGVHVAWTKRLASEPVKYEAQLGAALGALTGKKLPEGVLSQSLGNVTFLNDPLPATFQTMSQWTQELGFIKSVEKLDTLFDTALLQQVQSSP